MAALECLLYRSTVTQRIGPLHMLLLVERSRQANHAAGLTGCLSYVERSFVQYLEGAREALDLLWEKLLNDQRHGEIQLLARHAIVQRRYPDEPLLFFGNEQFAQYQLPGFLPATTDDLELLVERLLST